MVIVHAWVTKTGRLHLKSDCHAVRFQRDQMEPVLLDLEDETTFERFDFGDETSCQWCWR